MATKGIPKQYIIDSGWELTVGAGAESRELVEECRSKKACGQA